MKILDTTDLIDAAVTLPEGQFQTLVSQLEDATRALAEAVAKHLDIVVHDVSYQAGFGGLCATFEPRDKDQPCPPEIDAGDPEGDWP